jgi:hypothetical protein
MLITPYEKYATSLTCEVSTYFTAGMSIRQSQGSYDPHKFCALSIIAHFSLLKGEKWVNEITLLSDSVCLCVMRVLVEIRV